MKYIYMLLIGFILTANASAVGHDDGQSTPVKLVKLTFDVTLNSVYDAKTSTTKNLKGESALAIAQFYDSTIDGYLEKNGSYRVDFQANLESSLREAKYHLLPSGPDSLSFFMQNSEHGVKLNFFYGTDDQINSNRFKSVLSISGTMMGESWTYENDTDGIEYLSTLVGREYEFYEDSTWELTSGARGGKAYSGRATLSKFELVPVSEDEEVFSRVSIPKSSLQASAFHF